MLLSEMRGYSSVVYMSKLSVDKCSDVELCVVR